MLSVVEKPRPRPRYDDPRAARLAARRGDLLEHTANLAPGYVQGNLVVLPKEFAADFMLFCQRNPKPCPLIGVSDAGSPHVPELGRDLDLRTDIPRYRVWRDGALADEPTDVVAHWRSDLVAFVIGCSFTFEEALLADGMSLKHIDCGANIAMYRTNVPTQAAGAFSGPLVVSMRPLRPADAIRAIQITTRYPSVHGAPVHIGVPEAIGIADLAKPDYGEAVPVADDELPLFWACGVTPQAAIAAAKIPFAITHAPGFMLVTDKPNRDFAIL